MDLPPASVLLRLNGRGGQSGEKLTRSAEILIELVQLSFPKLRSNPAFISNVLGFYPRPCN
jgi:hypothetical protein